MPYDPRIHHRRSTRLKGYDYSQEGAYFITICTYQKRWLFGEVLGDAVELNAYGQIAAEYWAAIPSHFPHIDLDAYVIIPNHMHGIVFITRPPSNNAVVGARHYRRCAPLQPEPSIRQIAAGSLPAAVRSYKSAVTKQINELYPTPGERFWQRNYHDRIIRDERGLNALRQYIINNPAWWAQDQYYSSQ